MKPAKESPGTPVMTKDPAAMTSPELDEAACKAAGMEPRGWNYRFGWENEAQSYSCLWTKEEAEAHRLNHIAAFADRPNERGGRLVVGDLEVVWRSVSTDLRASARLETALEANGWPMLLVYQCVDGYAAMFCDSIVSVEMPEGFRVEACGEVPAVAETRCRAVAEAVVAAGEYHEDD